MARSIVVGGTAAGLLVALPAANAWAAHRTPTRMYAYVGLAHTVGDVETATGTLVARDARGHYKIPLAGRNVVVKVGGVTIGTRRTGSNGNWRITFRWPVGGTHRLSASWGGNRSYSGASAHTQQATAYYDTDVSASAATTTPLFADHDTFSGHASEHGVPSAFPLRNGSVALQFSADSAHWTTTQTSTTDRNGDFSFAPAINASGYWRVQTRAAADYRGATSAPEWVQGHYNGALVISAPGQVRVGAMVSGSGHATKADALDQNRPVSGGQVELLFSTDGGRTWSIRSSATTDGNGAYTLPAIQTTQPGLFRAELLAGNDWTAAWAPATTRVIAKDTSHVTLKAPRKVRAGHSFRLSGRLTDATTRKGLGRQYVTITLRIGHKTSTIVTIRTAADGSWSYTVAGAPGRTGVWSVVWPGNADVQGTSAHATIKITR
jgi:hypothetical protein